MHCVLLRNSYRKVCGFHISKFFTSNTAAKSNTQPHNCHSFHTVCWQFTDSIFLQQAERGVRSSLPGRRHLGDVGKASKWIGGRNTSYRWGENCTFISTSRLTETARRYYWPPTATFTTLHSGEEWMLNEAVSSGAHFQYPICKALGRIPNNKYLLMFQQYHMRKFTACDSARTVTKRVWIEARLELQIRRGSMFWNSFPRSTHSGTAAFQVTCNAKGHSLLHWVPGLFPGVQGVAMPWSTGHCHPNLAPRLRQNGDIPLLCPVPSWQGTGRTIIGLINCRTQLSGG